MLNIMLIGYIGLLQIINTTENNSISISNTGLGINVLDAGGPELATWHQLPEAVSLAGTKAKETGVGVSHNAGRVPVFPAD